MKSPLVKITDRDIEMFTFVWTWKLCTTRCLAEKYFSGKEHAAYVRLNKIAAAGYLRLINCGPRRKHYAWTLDKKGFRCLSGLLPDLKEQGYAPEYPDHDHYVTSFHLGDWFLGAPPGIEFFSEQQLRRIHDSFFPDWVPKQDGRRSDGYWKVPRLGEDKIFSLEVELNLKEQKDYGPIGHWYRCHEEISRVIWLVQNEKKATLLQERFKAVDPQYLKHNFITLSDFKKDGWMAKIIAGFEVGAPFKFSLCAGQTKLLKWTLNGRETFQAHLLLDGTICALDSAPSTREATPNFPNSMALQPYTPSTVLTSTITSLDRSPQNSQSKKEPNLKAENKNE